MKSQEWREDRRFQALELKNQGWKQYKIREALGVSVGRCPRVQEGE